MMTTMAALLGGIPLALGTGIGSELRRPLGIAMVGGLLLSQMLTLYTTPVIYIFFDAWRNGSSRKRSRRTTANEPQPAGASMNISSPFIHRPVATTLLTMAIAIAGRLRSWCCRCLRCRRWTSRRFRSGAGLPGASARDHGVVDCDAAGAAVRPHRGRDAR